MLGQVSVATAGDLGARLTPDVLSVIYPNAERIGPAAGEPPAAPVYEGDMVVGYLFSTLDVVAAPGYASVPFDVIAGVDLNREITGAKVIFHKETYIMRDPLRQVLLDDYLLSHDGFHIVRKTIGAPPPDFVSGATVSARAMRAAIVDSARLVLRARDDRPEITEPTLDREGFRPADWPQLLADKSIVRASVTNGAVADVFAADGAAAGVKMGPADERFIEIYTGLVTPPSVGRNLFGREAFKNYLRKAGERGNAIVVAGAGYDYFGVGYFKKANGYLFDRVQLAQGEQIFRFHRDRFQRLSVRGRDGIRSIGIAGLFILPADSGFDPLAPWSLQIMVPSSDAQAPFTTAFEVPYTLPEKHVLMPEPEPVPAWVEAWRDDSTNIAVLGGMLGVLTLIMGFQAPLTRQHQMYRWLRNGFLLFVLVWLGWIAGGQLSIINVFNYALAPFKGFGWGFYLAEPLILMIAIYTAFSLVVLGRGVFCGWLCPFGALQELLGQVARVLRIPQWHPSERLQRRLWWGKYASAAAVFGVVIYSLEMASTAAELEPFRTAITAKFARNWPYVVYAVTLLTIALFTERFYCRFLCPLGGVLALLGRLHLLDLLKRRPECGSPCHLCERSCPVKAIESSGKINMNECFQCLDCQVEYTNDKRCQPLAWERKRRVRAAAYAEPKIPRPALASV